MQRSLIIETAETHRATAAFSSKEQESITQHNNHTNKTSVFQFGDKIPQPQQQLREAPSLVLPPLALGQSGGEARELPLGGTLSSRRTGSASSVTVSDHHLVGLRISTK